MVPFFFFKEYIELKKLNGSPILSIVSRPSFEYLKDLLKKLTVKDKVNSKLSSYGRDRMKFQHAKLRVNAVDLRTVSGQTGN